MVQNTAKEITNEKSRGQAVTEFALAIPLIFSMVLGVLEFGVALAANIGVNRASQSAALMASEAGNIIGADCLILDEIERHVIPPASPSKITGVRVERTSFRGDTVLADNRWARTGTTTCTVADKLTVDLPYTISLETYPDVQRCNSLGGCPSMTPARSTVDSIAVVVTYQHDWVTPLGSLIPLFGGNSWDFEKRTVFRMEPHS